MLVVFHDHNFKKLALHKLLITHVRSYCVLETLGWYFLTLSKVVYILNFIIGRGSQAKGTKEERTWSTACWKGCRRCSWWGKEKEGERRATQEERRWRWKRCVHTIPPKIWLLSWGSHSQVFFFIVKTDKIM